MSQPSESPAPADHPQPAPPAPRDWGNAPPPGADPKPQSRGPYYTAEVLLGAVVLGALYGLAMRYVFDFAPFKGTRNENVTGGMMVSFVFLVPLVIGILTPLLVRAERPLSYAFAFFGPWLPIAFFCFGASVLLLEGAICIAIISPLLMLAGSVGGMIGAVVRSNYPHLGRRILPAVMALPLMTGYFEKEYVPDDYWARAERAVEIRAPAARVWQLVNHPTGIQPSEMAGGLAYRIGVPYPVEANTLSETVGGTRKLVWQKGVHFDEDITAIEPGKRICWTYRFAPDSFPRDALDDHVVIGGHYFDLGETCYTLTPTATGTRLSVSVEYRVSTNFNWYAGTWGRLLVGNTAETILNFYRVRAEKA